MRTLPIIPDQLKPSASERLLCVLHARGSQIYICQRDAHGNPAWVLKAPEADLIDEHGNVVGRHYAGPTWRHKDGSLVTAKLVTRVDSPHEGAIPWLLLAASGHLHDGIFSRVTSIQRVNTVAGLPAHGCGEADLDKEARSHYTADYFFYTST